MNGQWDRFAGHRYAPGYEPKPTESYTVIEGLTDVALNLGDLWPVFGALGLLFVVLSRSARRRSAGTNRKLIRDLEAQARRESFSRIAQDLRLRRGAGDTGEY